MMRMYDIIIKKRDGCELTADEIQFFVEGVTKGVIPDEQTAAFLMAVYFKGMTPHETVTLTLAMARSGDMVDLSGIPGVKVDKHSTGGVGDKTTLIVAPIAAACGVPVAKMSGKGLGHTGGTVDKLASIPGFCTELPGDAFIRAVNTCGLCVVGQSGNLAPADKKLYALRDVTGTVDSLPLIAASIMSKKLAAGSDCILLDVKTGSGAFMKTLDDSVALAKAMVAIGEGAGKNTVALITGMNRPLGYAIGNSLEVIEAAETLQGRGPADLYEISVILSANMLWQAGVKDSLDECRAAAEDAVTSGAALQKLKDMIEMQGGDSEIITHPERFAKAAFRHLVAAPETGYIQSMDTTLWGIASVKLGAGRETKDSPIDYSAGIMLHKKTGDYVQAGEVLAEFFTNQKERLADAEKTALTAVSFGNDKPESEPLVFARVDKQGASMYS